MDTAIAEYALTELDFLNLRKDKRCNNLENELIKTKTVQEWRKAKPDLHKQLAVFLIG